jgi:hypothetical protein
MNCEDETRRDLVRAARSTDGQQLYNGLDYVEVTDDQLTLVAYFLGKLPAELSPGGQPALAHLRLEGGQRVQGIRLTGAEAHVNADPERDDYLAITVDQPGDFSTYTLRLVGVEGIDPRYDHADFSFKAGCATDLDCAAEGACPTPALAEPDLNYLAKDYESFRQLILDRLAVIMPDWHAEGGRHAPDLEIALVEVLAYVGDHLSYYQDAVATEAYLNTARQRISVRRHARLVDYRLHEGDNARAWVCVTTDQDLALTPQSGAQAAAGDFYFITAVADTAQITGRAVTENDLRQVPASAYEVFEPLGDTTLPLPLRVSHNEIRFYTWGNRECCLPCGATAATLLDQWVYVDPAAAPAPAGPPPRAPRPAAAAAPPALDPTKLKRALNLAVGDVLILEEVLGPKTGQPADADPSHRYPVRLTSVTRAEDPVVLTTLDVNGQTNMLPTPVVEIEWASADALPDPLCLTAIGPAPDCLYLDPVSVAHGNVVLVDHGRTLQPPEYLGQVPLLTSEAACECEGEPGDVVLTAGRFEPRLSKTPLTFSQALRPAPASQALDQDPRTAVPSINLLSIPGKADGSGPAFTWADLSDATHLAQSLSRASSPLSAALGRGLRLSPHTQRLLTTDAKLGSADYPDMLRQALQTDLAAMLEAWTPRFDLMESGPQDAQFVVEMDNDGVAHLRFGDGELGRRPSPGSAFYATYRVGNGTRGNVGAGAIAQLVSRSTLDGPTLGVRNPLPARGGADPEPLAQAKLYAPAVFRQRLERAIVADDYAQIAKRDFDAALQQAKAELAWTGSWFEAEVALDPRGTESTSAALADLVADHLERYRRLGHDLRVEPARYVPLDVALTVCVEAHYLRGEVEAALLDVFTTGLRANGQPGFFNPDQFTFGGGVYVSRLVAAAQAVPGVESVTVTRLERLFEGPNHEIENGVLPLGPLEVARLDNDPNYPEHGRFALVMQGGR